MTPDELKTIFRHNLKRERQERGWSHHTLAEKADLPRNSIQNCEWKGTFSAKTVAGICKALEIDPWVLFIEEAESE